MKMRPNAPANKRIERRLRILIKRQHIAAVTPVAVKFVPLLLCRAKRCPSTLKWQFRVTEYCCNKHTDT